MGYSYSSKKNSLTKINNISTSSNNERNYNKNEAAQGLAKYLHGTCFPPSSNTLIESIRQNCFTTWPGLIDILIQKHLPPSIYIAKGCLNQNL